MNNTRRFIAEWESQSAILIAWPHENTDWAYMLEEVEQCYINIANTILQYEDLYIITTKPEYVKSKINTNSQYQVYFIEVENNDTWCRDFGAITIEDNGRNTICDFKFNAWGGKFNWDLDNQVTSKMANLNLFNCEVLDYNDFILEGGSIETDGKGTLLVTTNCLLTTTRNAQMTKSDIEKSLCERLGVSKVLWLEHGALAGDDTDSHIDTLARIAPNDNIIYVGCNDISDEHYSELKTMEEELKSFTNIENNPFKLHKLPFPNPIYDENKERLPATYANYLIVNGAVLVPTYNQQQNDIEALSVIKNVFPEHDIIGIDCNALIKQHGSLHCITMQFPTNTLK